MSVTSEKRLRRELMRMQEEPIDGVIIDWDRVEANLFEWNVKLCGLKDPRYDGQEFQLRFRFPPLYPFNHPHVTFVGENIPVHPFVSENGFIYLNIFGVDWTPALTVESMLHCIISMMDGGADH